MTVYHANFPHEAGVFFTVRTTGFCIEDQCRIRTQSQQNRLMTARTTAPTNYDESTGVGKPL